MRLASTTIFVRQIKLLQQQHTRASSRYKYPMAKKKSVPIPEDLLRLTGMANAFLSATGATAGDSTETPSPPTTVLPIVDTHTHLLGTFSAYRLKYPNGKYTTVHEFARAYYAAAPEATTSATPAYRPQVTKIVDVYCEAPVVKAWKELADSALTEELRRENWGGMEYHFVIGVHPHEARHYTDKVEEDLIEAAMHPRCVGMGEMGLDFHYDNSPREIQKDVLRRQLKCVVHLGKSLTIHTREADNEILPILKEALPKNQRIHIHCFTDTPELAKALLDHFPNLCIGITGVVTFATNLNTKAVIENMVKEWVANGCKPDPEGRSPLRIVLETDAPYMTPGNLNVQALGLKPGARLPFCHSGMIPWTAKFVADVATAAADGKASWKAEDILRIGGENAQRVYGI